MNIQNVKKIIRSSRIGEMIWPVLAKKKRLYYSKKSEKQVYKLGKASEKHIFYCGICESSNMGDMAQTYCTLKWIENNYPDYQILFCKTSVFREPRCNLIGTMHKVMKPDDLIFFQSGYNTHDLGDGREDIMHQKVLVAFPDTQAIMLPQTVYFRTDKRKKQCADIYNAHTKMLFLARDPISYDYAINMFPNLTVLLYPDIVSSLIGYMKENNNREGIYLCRRRDVEQYYGEEDYRKFVKILESYSDSVTVSDTIIKASNSNIYNQLDKYISNMIISFSKFRLVVTDKFHGLIFSLVANTPVIVLRTKDHKVTSGYEWFSKIYPDRVFYAETIEEIKALTEKILQNPSYSQLDNYFDREYYHKLKDVIDNWRKSNGNMQS